MPPRRFRVYPATVAWEHNPHARWRKVLAILEGSTLQVFGKHHDHPSGTPTHQEGVVLVATFEVSGHGPVNGGRAMYLVDLPDTSQLRISDEGGCGCKDILLGFRP